MIPETITAKKMVVARDNRSAQFVDNMTLPDWQAIGKKLKELDDSVKLIVGDWFNEGQNRFQNLAQQSLELIGLDCGQVREFAATAKQIPPGHRTPKLRYGHFQAIAAEAPKAKQLPLISYAVEKKLTVSQLRQHIRRENATERIEDKTPAVAFCMLTETLRWQRWVRKQNFRNWTPESREKLKSDLLPFLDMLIEVHDQL